jgi:hypothetical protein
MHLLPSSPTLLRFEGILDVWWRICDPQLRVLDTYRLGEPTSEHHALAHLANSHVVVTTNFDGLIERASAAPTKLHVAYTDHDFKTTRLEPGLYKIHGTLQRLINGRIENVTVREEGFPIATLRAISGNMESVERRSFLHQLRRSHPLIVVGYSGMDDFDICRWLFEPGSPREAVWIAYDKTASRTKVLSCQQAVNERSAPRPISRVAKGPFVDNWRIVLTDNPALLLAELSNQQFNHAAALTERLDWGSPSDWQRAMVTGMLLLQLSRLRDTEALLRCVIGTIDMSPVERLLAEMWLAQTLIPTGDPGKRNDALTYAATVANSDLMDEMLKLRATFLAVQAKFFTRRLTPSEFSDQLTALYDKAKSAGDTELVVDISVFGGQQARTHETMTTAFKAAEAGGSLLAKGIALHEAARAKWPDCVSPDALRTKIAKLKEAIDFRVDLGQLDGVCASRNVCGVMQQRVAEWTSPATPDYAAATGQHSASLELASELGLVWHRSQALISLAYIAAKTGKLAELRTRITELEGLSYLLDDSDRHHVNFLTGFSRVLEGNFEAASTTYKSLVSLPPSMKIANRMSGAATFNAALCRAWANNEATLPEALPDTHANVAFWRARFRDLRGLPKALALIDPLPP